MRALTLVDFAHRLRVNFHARSPDSGPNDAGAATLQDLSDWRRNADHLIVAWDAPPYLRTQAFAEYKQGRVRDEAYIQICRWTKERLVKDGYSIAFSAGHEADDCIATLAVELAPRFDEVRIVSEDKDLLSCLTDKVMMYAPKSRGEFEIRDVQWLRDKWGIAPKDVALFLAICGDKSDAIPGVAGIGEKGAAKLITEFGSIANMRIAATVAFEESQREGAKPLAAFWKKFLEGSPRLPEWLNLTTLRTDLPLDVDALLVKQKVQPLVVTPENIEHGDAWEPSSEDLEEERQLLDPEVVISGPKGSVASATVTTATYADAPKVTEAKTEPPKVSAPHAERTMTPQPQTPITPGSGTASIGGNGNGSMHTGEASTPVSIVVDRPAPPSWALALQPASARDALAISKTLLNSRFFASYGTPEGIYAVISLGRELGMGMMQALQGFHIVQDKPFAKWQTLLALAESDPNCEWIMCVESTDERCTWRTKHRKRPEAEEYTYDRAEAQRNGCYTGANKHNWNARERQMMRKTCLANAVRIWYSGRTSGLYIPEEMNE